MMLFRRLLSYVNHGSQWLKRSQTQEPWQGMRQFPATRDRLLRYATTIDRSITRAIDRLERLQRRRRSELIRQETDRIQ